MPNFPVIGCHAVAQYPSAFETSFAVSIQRAVDGSEQRFVRPGQARRSWRILLHRLHPEDAERVVGFFTSLQGRASSFRFQDPWTGQWYEPCWFDTDTLPVTHESDQHARADLRIVTAEEI